MKRTLRMRQPSMPSRTACLSFLCGLGLALAGCGSMSGSGSAPVPDTTPPSVPANLVATVASNTQINLTWTASTDNVGVTGYKVQRCQGAGCSNFTQIATPTTTSFNDTGLTGSTSYNYRAQATDAAGNLSAFSTAAVAMTSAPTITAPSNLTATAAGPSQINLAWTAGTETGGTITNYLVQRCTGAGCSNFVQVGTSTTITFNDTGLTASTSYSYRVQTTDAAGDLSAFSTAAVTMTSAPTITAPSNLTATDAGPTQINLAWTAGTETGGTISQYLVQRCAGAGCGNFVQVGTSTTTTFNNTGLSASTSYSYRAQATDAAGNLSAFSTAAVAMTSAPTFTAPSNLTATDAGPSQINLAWTAGTETGGTISQYLVERCLGVGCNNFAQVGTSAATTFNDTGLMNPQSYSYRVKATDSAGDLSAYSAIASASTSSSSVSSVSISPKRGGVAVSQTLALSANVVGDPLGAGVTWTKTGGTFANSTPTSITFSSTAAGAFTITATSISDNTVAASVTIGVTDLAGVTTYHNDASRDGVNSHEFALTTANVNTATFGKLFSCPVDAEVYAQPLWIPSLAIGGGTHNVIFVATQNDSVYAFDADASPCKTYWQRSFLSAGVTAVPYGDTGTNDINNLIGITGTPVIDPVGKTLYAVAKTKEGSGNYHQRLHAIKLIDGTDTVPAFDITPAITVPGSGDTGDSSVGCTSNPGNVPFCPLREAQRPGLALANGVVYVTWASHGDNGTYHGWIMGFSAANLNLVSTFNDSPDGRQGGIWMSGGAPALDASNNLYVITGNGDFNANSATAPNRDYGDSYLKLTSGLSVVDFFTPANQGELDGGDLDLGSGGAVVLVDLPASAPHQHLLVGGGKGSSFNGEVFVVDRDNMGHFNTNTNNVVQTFALGSGIFSTAAFWQNTLYIAGVCEAVMAFPLNTQSSTFNTTPASQSSHSFCFPGTTPAISSSVTTNGIAWALDTNSSSASNTSGTDGPTVLYAYDALNLATELFHSDATFGAPNAAGFAVKFCVPTVANGKVYVGTQTELTVFGLLPN